MSKGQRSRVYTRQQGGQRRYYGDFRNEGGGREALIARGESRATTDRDVAEKIASARLAELRTDRRDSALLGLRRRAKLGAFAAEHLVKKAQSGRFSQTWLVDTERMLRCAIDHFGTDRDLASIGVADVQAWIVALSAKPSKRRRADGAVATLSGGSVRHYLNVLSGLFRRAAAESCVPSGHNPVSSLIDKPSGTRKEAIWLEIDVAALLLEAARLYEPQRKDAATPYHYPLVATFLLTGGRESEVLGLEISDVDFARETVTFRPNKWRGLKTATSHRVVPLFPQLATILKDYLRGGEAPRVGGLLFPSPRPARTRERQPGEPGMIQDFRKTLDAISERAGWRAGEIRSRALRHTFCSARLQCTDNGAAISVFTVARELGHGGESLVRRIYGHLGVTRHRSPELEYRVEQHTATLGDRVHSLRMA